MSDLKTVAIIPVRGGSRGISRKNARLLCGKPLLAYSVEAVIAAACVDLVYVSTDDDELSEIAQRYGAGVLSRPEKLALDHVGLDEVICDAVEQIERLGIDVGQVVTIQATCPLISRSTIDKACLKQIDEGLDTVLTVVDDTHLGWGCRDDGSLFPLYEGRVNRQLLPRHYRETGGVVVCPRHSLEAGSRFGEKVGVVEVNKTESIDVDDYFDWWMAEKSLRRKRICFHVIGNSEAGLGHVYRALTLADRLINHDILFVVNSESDMAWQMIQQRFYLAEVVSPGQEAQAIINSGADLVINDVLDTDEAFMHELKDSGICTMNFEDLKDGSLLADYLINAMYDSHSVRSDGRYYQGISYCCLRDEFYSLEPQKIKKDVQNVLLLFGGTDSGELTFRTLQWIDGVEGDWKIMVIVGVGYKDISKLQRFVDSARHKVEIICGTTIISRYMGQADVAITSAGRTVFELATLAVPMLVIAQNEREMNHIFACESTGVIYCGLGRDLQQPQFTETFEQLLGNELLRKKMSRILLETDIGSGIDHVLEIIENALDHCERKES